MAVEVLVEVVEACAIVVKRFIFKDKAKADEWVTMMAGNPIMYVVNVRNFTEPDEPIV